jgi:lipopolysaccharide export system protein LptA
MTMRKAPDSRRLLPCLAVLVIAAASGASAQPQPQPSGPPNALQGFSQNRNQPVKINAASLEVHDRNKIATFTGNVHLVQGDTTLSCKILVVYYDADQAAGGPTVKSTTPAAPGPSGSQQISKMEAKGGVIVTQKDQTAAGDSAIYDMKTNTVTLFAPAGGSVSVTQGGSVVKGDGLVVNLASGVSHFEGRVSALVDTKNAKDDHRPPADTKAAPAQQPPQPRPAHPNRIRSRTQGNDNAQGT